MPTIDERIKEELQNETDLFDALIPESVVQNINAKTTTVVLGVILLIAGIGIYCLVQFVTATSLPEIIRWGVWLLISSIGLVLVELWTWMQIGRLATQREIRQLEINIRQFVAAQLP